jgi:hypothetical protein
MKTEDELSEQAAKRAREIYPMANQDDYPENPNVNRLNNACVGAFMNGYRYASQQNVELKAENERLKVLINDGMQESFMAGKNADEWDQMCGWIQHYTYADWVAKWRKTNQVLIVQPKEIKI